MSSTTTSEPPEVPEVATMANDRFHGYRNPVLEKSCRESCRTIGFGTKMKMSCTTDSARASGRLRKRPKWPMNLFIVIEILFTRSPLSHDMFWSRDVNVLFYYRFPGGLSRVPLNTRRNSKYSEMLLLEPAWIRLH